jgi:hypothetical protein
MAEVVNLKNGIMENFPMRAKIVISPRNLSQHRHSVAQGRACCGSQSWCKSRTP